MAQRIPHGPSYDEFDKRINDRQDVDPGYRDDEPWDGVSGDWDETTAEALLRRGVIRWREEPMRLSDAPYREISRRREMSRKRRRGTMQPRGGWGAYPRP